MSMEIQCRTVCSKCKGTGKNELSDAEAYKKAQEERQQFPGGILMRGQYGPIPIEVRVRELQQCSHCDDGYNMFWTSLDAVLKENNDGINM